MNLTDGNDPDDIEEVFYEMNLPVFRIVMETAPMGQVRTVLNTLKTFFAKISRFEQFLEN